MRRSLPALALFLLASAVNAYASVSVLVIAIGNPDSPALSRVIGTAAVVQLQRADLAATNETGAAGSSSVARATSGSNAAPADFVLVVSYTNTRGQVTLELTFRETRTGKTIATSSKTVPFDLNLDVNVSNTVATLLAEPEVERAIKAARERQPPKKAANVTRRPPPNRATPQAAGGAGATPAQPHARIGWRYVLELHGAPMVLVGNSSNYFRYGIDVSVYNGVQLPLQRLTVEMGLVTGASQLFPAVLGTTAGKVYAIGVGPQIKIGSDPRTAANVGFVASGGVTFILAQPANMSFEAKTDLYAAGGVSATLKVFHSAVVGMEMSARVVFEERYPIVAVIPAVTVGF